jgi:hypothetical protein
VVDKGYDLQRLSETHGVRKDAAVIARHTGPPHEGDAFLLVRLEVSGKVGSNGATSRKAKVANSGRLCSVIRTRRGTG